MLSLFPHILLQLHKTLDENPAVWGSTIQQFHTGIIQPQTGGMGQLARL